ncbi:hypothetical protein [Natronobacterium texcoconense]|nr:hypothetical protein [Natronobacterium texcoconense]
MSRYCFAARGALAGGNSFGEQSTIDSADSRERDGPTAVGGG